jgi:uncharacterized membrane protein YccF (DUF307 family)
MDWLLFLILRIVWFVFVGLPLGVFFLHVGWFCMITVIGIPLGIWIFNRIPMIMTLQMNIEDRYRLEMREVDIFKGNVEQWPLLPRLLYLVFVGWWLSLLWLWVAFGFAATIIGVPIGFWMFNRFPAVIFLTRT